jgi:glutamate dehydrogenase
MTARHRAGLAALTGGLESVLPPARQESLRQAAERLGDSGVPADLALDIARLAVLAQAPAIAEIAQETGADMRQAARIFLEIGARLRIDELAGRGAAIVTADRYDRLAIAKALAQLEAAHAAFTREAIRAGGSEMWLAGRGDRLTQAQRLFTDAAGEGAITVSRLSVAAGALRELAAAAT